jgi:hypothetical protein
MCICMQYYSSRRVRKTVFNSVNEFYILPLNKILNKEWSAIIIKATYKTHSALWAQLCRLNSLVTSEMDAFVNTNKAVEEKVMQKAGIVYTCSHRKCSHAQNVIWIVDVKHIKKPSICVSDKAPILYLEPPLPSCKSL